LLLTHSGSNVIEVELMVTASVKHQSTTKTFVLICVIIERELCS